MDPSERKIIELTSEIEKLRLKTNVKEKLLGRTMREFEVIAQKLAHKQEELRRLNSQLEKAKDLLKQSFQRYVSAQIVEEIMQSSEPVNLRGDRKTVSILLSDIRGFTGLSEQLEPEDLVQFLNSYFSAMIDIIFEHEGMLDKFMGDAVLALFGAPVTHHDDALRAVKAAIAMQRKLRELNEIWRTDGKPNIKIGIGISTGEVVVGNIGSERRMEYTVIGQDVNYAQRIEALTKDLPADILISESTFERIKDQIVAERYGPITIKGKKDPMTVYGVLRIK